MKRFIIVGLGKFGVTLATRLHALDQEVVAIDQQANLVDAIGPRVARAVVGDATQRGVLEEVGAGKADGAVISTGNDIGASVLTLLALRDLEVAPIFVKVNSAEHARIAEALGASETVFPERESALGLALRMTSGKLLQYVQLGAELSLQEMPVPLAWQNKTLRELSLPHNYRVQVVAIHDTLRDVMEVVPDPDKALTKEHNLLVAGHPASLDKLAKLR